MIERPPILRGTSEEQIYQLYLYLCQMADQLNYDITNLGDDKNGEK